MKKLCILLVAILSFSCYSVKAQSFNIPDTIYATVSEQIHVPDSITNNASTGLSLNWHVLSTNFSNDWLSALGICDNNVCRYNIDSSLWPGDSTFYSGIYVPGYELGFTINLEFSSMPTMNGIYYITLKLVNTVDSTDTRNTTVIFGYPTTSIASVNKGNDNISIYPNPANDMLYTDFGNNTQQITEATIYDITGRALSNTVINGTRANVQLTGIAPGTYFVRFTDVSGKMISTKEFIRQ